jgi:Uma2 family endonuclease
MMPPQTLAMPGVHPLPPAIPGEYIWRLTLDQFHEMIRNGILTDSDPVELLEGWLVTKMPRNPPHRLANRRLRDSVEGRVTKGWHVNVQEPIALVTSEPEPDLSVIRGGPEDFADHNPAASDVGMTAEVSDTTLTRDRTIKKRIYARARIPVYWIVNLVDRQVEVYTQPSGPADEPDYAQRQDYVVGNMVPLVLDGQQLGVLPVAELFA